MGRVRSGWGGEGKRLILSFMTRPVVVGKDRDPHDNGREVRGLADDLNDLRRLLNYDHVWLLFIRIVISIIFF
jgi:hypothetical protein